MHGQWHALRLWRPQIQAISKRKLHFDSIILATRNNIESLKGIAIMRPTLGMSGPLPVDLIDVISFVQVVETGSISNAAARLSIAKSIVSRRISRLEAVLGAQLLSRTPRGTTLTDIGRQYHERVGLGLSEMEAAREVVNRLTAEISGPLRVHVESAFGEFLLAPFLAEFAQLHPLVQLDLRFEDREVNMNREAYDVAIWLGPASDASLITRKLAKVRWSIVASAAYLEARGQPTTPAELAGHDVVLHALDSGTWRLQGSDGWEQVRMNSRVRASSGHMLLAAARANLGLARLPTFMVDGLLESGELSVLPPFVHDFPDLHIFMPPARAGTARVRALVTFLYERMGGEV